MKLLVVACIGVCLAVTGCSQQAEEGAVVEKTTDLQWVEVSPAQMTEAQKSQQSTMSTAIKALGTELMGELTTAMAGGDASAAISVCREKAPTVAAKVAQEHGLKIGRTSHKLRNPANVAPAWAQGPVSDLAETPTYLAGPHGELGGLLPIRLKAGCLMCHGPADRIDETIRAALAADYPDDRAVGFAEGDLRGWFWVEAPPVKAAAEL